MTSIRIGPTKRLLPNTPTVSLLSGVFSPLARWTERAADLAASTRGAAAFGLLAIGAYWLQSLAWPLRGGRDVGTYLTYYADIGHDPPVFPVTVTAIQPGSPAVLGFLLDHVGAAGVEIALSLAFAASVWAYVRLGAIFGRWVALSTGVVLLVYPAYAALFHEVSSDQLFALGVALWALAVAWALRAPSAWRFALAGSALVLLVLVRAAGVPLAIVGLSPLLLALPWRRRLAYSGVFASSCIAALILATTYNGVRYGEFTLSRTANAGTLFGVFAHDRLVSPENGQASRELARAVTTDLLHREPYRSYGITVEEFFADASDRYWADLVSLSDRYWGWDSRYSRLRDVAIEAVRARPGAYAASVGRKLANQFTTPFQREATRRPTPSAAQEQRYVVVEGRRLPLPTEGQPIPASNLDWQLSTPEQTTWMDWRSIERPRIRFAEPSTAALYDDMRQHVEELLAKLSARDGSQALADGLNWVGRQFPMLWLWLVAGVLGVAVRRPRNSPVILALLAFALASVLVASLTQPLFLQYRIPLDPVFLLFGLVGLVGDRSRRGVRRLPVEASGRLGDG